MSVKDYETDDATINMFWHGRHLPPLVWACMRSFVYHGHRLRVFSYGDFEVPTGVVLEDADTVLPRPVAFDSYQTIAQHADIFRYQLLHKYGGWWVDTDVYCLTDDLPLQAYAWAEQEPGVVNNAILKFPKGDSLSGRLLQAASLRCDNARHWGALGRIIETVLARRGDARHWRALRRLVKTPLDWDALGPKLLTEVVAGAENIDRGGSKSAFYPWHWLESSFVWLPRCRQEVENRQKGAQFLHFWAYALRSMGVDIYRDPPSNSFLAQIIQGCPNRVASDADDLLKTERSICEFMRQVLVRDKWRKTLKGDPDDLFGVVT